MKMIRILLNLILLLVLVFSSASTVFAQSDTQVRITQVDNSKFPTVTVYVSVTNSAGEPVGVDPATIQISENGEKMQIVDARGGGQGGQGVAEPLTTMLVIDISGSMDKNNKLTAAKDAAKAYVNQMRAGDQAGLMTFDTKTYYVQPVTTDTAALTSAIDELKTGGDTAMFDALVEAEKNLSSIPGRKAIIVLADGLDNHSQNTVDSVIEQIGPSGLTISTVGFGDASTASQSGLDEAALKSLAERSGGLYSFAADSQSLSALYQQLGRTLQSEYAITYVSPSTLRDGINRNLTVSLSGVGATTETNYNPGGVLPEVTGVSWTLFGLILAGLLLLLFAPLLIVRGAGLFRGMKQKGKVKMANTANATSSRSLSGSGSGKKPRIKLK
ncbi:MAG TPA: VWA domain-containing protein [Anaerolineales bacterium]|nr:VWA domain-containing protein [Anaerolineales bacterium]